MKNKISKIKPGEVIIYQISKNNSELRVRFEGETVWLTQSEIAELYDKDRSVISKHIKQIFLDKEVNKKSNVHFLHIAKSDKPVAFFSLDVILAIGYRTNSAKAIHFRKWATNILKKYLLQGYALNRKRLLQAKNNLEDLQQTILFLKEKSGNELLAGQEKEILNILANYSKTLTFLSKYDKDELKLIGKFKGKFILNYNLARNLINQAKNQLLAKKEASLMFAQENGDKFRAILGNIYQTFDGKDLYSSIEEKAAHLLYFVIKDHPFVDGNKRSASLLFVYFLDKNNYLYRISGEKKISDNALAALALLIAISDPNEKDKLIKMITNLLNF